MVRVAGASSIDLMVGQQWNIRVVSGAVAPVLTVVLPDDTVLAPPVLFEADGRNDALEQIWKASFPPQAAGRYVAAVTDGSGGAAVLQAFVSAMTMNADMPSADTLDNWIGQGEHSWTQPELADAVSIAMRAQRRVCRVPVALPDDLREAIHRRAARYLALRKQLTAQPRDDGDFDSGPAVPPGRDFEVRALEAPFRRTPIG